MGLRSWLDRKAREKQSKNVVEAAGQAVGSVRFAASVAPHGTPLDTALKSLAVTQAVERNAERIAYFSAGPMHAQELWKEVFEPLVSANETMFERPVAEVLNDMLRRAHTIAVTSGVVTSDELDTPPDHSAFPSS